MTMLQVGAANAACAAVLALAALAAGRWSRRPALAHSLWLLVLLKLVTPPLFPLSLAWLPAEPAAPPPPAPERYVVLVLNDGERATTATAPTTDAPAPEAPPARSLPAWLPEALVAVWLGGAAVWFARAGRHVWRFHSLLRHGTSAPEEMQQRARALAARLGLRRCPEVVFLPGPLPPMVWAALGRPRVYLPRDLLARLDADQIDALLAHELAHVRRRDHWARWLELVAVGLYWWYPLAWWARKQLQDREEELCDAWVVGAVPARAYATAILETLDFLAQTGTPVPAMASGLGRAHALRQRLTLILRGGGGTRLGAPARLAVLALAGALLPLVPVLAHTPPPPAPPTEPVAPEQPTFALTFDAVVERPVEAGLPAVVLAKDVLWEKAAVSADGRYLAVVPRPFAAPPEAAGVGPAGGFGGRTKVTSVAFDVDGRLVYVQQAGEPVRLWDGKSGMKIVAPDRLTTEHVVRVALVEPTIKARYLAKAAMSGGGSAVYGGSGNASFGGVANFRPALPGAATGAVVAPPAQNVLWDVRDMPVQYRWVETRRADSFPNETRPVEVQFVRPAPVVRPPVQADPRSLPARLTPTS
jgi:beta-lactamase regulating signal transducer with metallopeptidase domain